MARRIIGFALAGIAALALVVPGGAANAARGGGVEKHGSCDGRGRWELDLERDNGRIEVDFEVTAAPAGQRWKIKIHHDGVKVFQGTRVTHLDDDDRPDLEVDRSVKDHIGLDRFTVRARNTVTGAFCMATAKL